MPLYIANSDFAQMEEPFALRSMKRAQIIGLWHPRPDTKLLTTTMRF